MKFKILLLILLLLPIVSAMQTTVVIKDTSKYNQLLEIYKRDMESEARRFVQDSDWYDSITNTDGIDYNVKKYVTAQWLRESYISGDVVVEINNTKYKRAYVYDYNNQTFKFKEEKFIEFKQYIKTETEYIKVVMDKKTYELFLFWHNIIMNPPGDRPWAEGGI